MSVIIDRRLNDRNKSASNRARFMRRYKHHIQRAIKVMVSERSITDMEQGGSVSIPTRDISEPAIRHGSNGDRDMVLPGNKTFNPGDRLKRPEGQGAGGAGDGEGGGDGEDGFAFTLSREEFMSLFFDDLELPHLVRTQVGSIREMKPQRAGYSAQGSPVNLSVVRTLRQAMGRRIAVSGEARRRLALLEAQLSETSLAPAEKSTSDVDRLREEIEALRRRIERVPFLDDVDLRYRNRTLVPRPVSQAVVFCLMDVSASMDEERKDLAKRFYTLLYLFLSRKYEHVELVFIRHTDNAEEVDEERFFHDRKSGGTVVFSALSLMHEIITDRYPTDDWNIYGAQVSDGDAFGVDPERSRQFLEAEILPLARYFAYVEVGKPHGKPISTLSAAYRRVEDTHFAMTEVRSPSDIYPVFRDLFSSDQQPRDAV